MARKQSKPQPAEIPEEELSQDIPEEPAARVIEPEPANGKSISKADAIRRALAEGLTTAKEALPFIKTHFGQDITPGHWAASKSREKGIVPTQAAPAEEGPAAPRRGRPPGKANAVKVTVKRGRKPKAAPSQAEATSPAPAVASGAETDLLAAMEAMKPLVAKLGADRVKRIAELLG